MAGEKRVGAMDFAYLEGFAAGDLALVDELLTLFRGQAQGWAVALSATPGGWREIVHTIKGTSRGVGAFVLGDACARAEVEGEVGLPEVVAALEAVVADIAAYQARP